MFDQLFDGALLESVVRSTIPILLAALGGMIAERAGVFQISLEGLMLIGAFAAVAGSFLAESALVGFLFAIVIAAIVSLILPFASVTRQGNMIVVGIAINLLALGITGFLLAQLFNVRGVFQHERIQGIDTVPVPWLSDLPVIGPAFFDQTIPTYIAFLLVVVLWVFLFRTVGGLRLRGVGERPAAAVTLGVRSVRYKYLAVAFSGALAGMAGAQLALGNVVMFAENMSAGRGWIAVIAVLLGRAHPVGVLAAAILFGFTEGLGFRLQGNGMPVQITDALPFLMTLLALVIFRKRFAKLLDFGTPTS